MPAPDVTVVIATHRRETRLRFALEALAAQTLEPGRFEVIVVRSPAPGVEIAEPEGLDVRFLRSPVANIAAQRNIGWREARAALIAFTDDDCRPAAAWLERLLEGTGSEDSVLQGRTEPDPEERHLDYGIARTIRVYRADRWYQACNIAYPRDLLERLDGFDEDFQLHCEDTDLGLRAEREGAQLVFCNEALVHHAVHVRSFRQAVRDAVRLSAEPALLARHPGQRRELHLGVFTSEEHARLVLALVGLALAPRSRLLAVAGAYPYVRGRVAKRLRDPNPLSPIGIFRLAADIAVEGAVDAVEIAAKLRSSVRHGEIVL